MKGPVLTKDFYQGAALVLAALARDSGEPTIAAGIIAGYGMTLKDFVNAGVDDYDLAPIRKMFREEYQLRSLKSPAALSRSPKTDTRG